MAPSWFDRFTSLVSSKTKKKQPKRQPLKSFFRDLYLEHLENRVTPVNNFSFSGGTLTTWIENNSTDVEIFTNGVFNTGGPNQGTTTGSLLFFAANNGSVTSGAWINGEPTTLANPLGTGFQTTTASFSTTFTGPSGSAVVDPNSATPGIISGVAVRNPGAGFSRIPLVTITPGAGDTTGGGATAFSRLGLLYFDIGSAGAGFNGGFSGNNVPLTLSFTVGAGITQDVAPTATGTVVNGKLTSIQITNPGAFRDTVAGTNTLVNLSAFTISDGTSTSNATATGFLSLRNFTMITSGSLYTASPNITISGGAITGITATAVNQAIATPNLSVTNSVESITLNHAGASYTTAPTITVTDATGSGVTTTATLGILQITLTNQGTSYTTPAVQFVGGVGSGASATILRDTSGPNGTSGAITSILITSVGSYSVLPTIQIVDIAATPTGSGATATLTGFVRNIAVNNPGSNYSAPNVSVKAPLTNLLQVDLSNAAYTGGNLVNVLTKVESTGNNLVQYGTATQNVDFTFTGPAPNTVGIQMTSTGNSQTTASLRGFIRTRQDGDVNLNVGTINGSSILIDPISDLTGTGGKAILTQGSGGITLIANNQNGVVQISKPLQAQGGGASVTITGGQNSSTQQSVLLNSSITTKTGNIDFAGNTTSVLLGGTENPISLQSESGNISFGGFLDAASSQNIQIGSSGSLTFNNHVGGLAAFPAGLGDIILSNGINQLTAASLGGLSSVLAKGTITARSITMNNPQSAVQGNMTFNATQKYNNSSGTSTSKVMDLYTTGGGSIKFLADVEITGAPTGSNQNVNLQANNQGSVTFAKSFSTPGDFTIDQVTGFTLGNNTTNSTLSVLGPNGLTFNSNTPITLAGVATLQVASGESITVNGSINGGFNLFLNSTGDILFANVGNTTALGTISLAGQAASLTFGGTTLKAAGLTTAGNTVVGNIDLSAPTTQVITGDVVLSGKGDIVLNTMSLGSAGNITLNNNNNGGKLILKGSITGINQNFTQTGANGGVEIGTGGVNTTIDITVQAAGASGTGVNFQNDIKLFQSLNSSTLGAGAITLQGTVDSAAAGGSNARSLSLSTVNGDITFGNDLGSSNSLAAATILTSGNGVVRFNSSANMVRTSGNQRFKGNSVISDDSTFDASTGNITFDNDLSGSSNLTKDLIITTSGDVTFGSLGQGATGTAGAIQDIQITAANPASFTVSGALSAQSFSTSAGARIAGNVSIVGAQTYTDAGGAAGDNDLALNVTGSITMGNIQTVDGIALDNGTGAGDILIGNVTATGAATFSHGGDLQFQGQTFKAATFSETSTNGGVLIGTGALGTVNIEVTATGADLNFINAVLLQDSAVLKGTGAGSDISFAKTLRSAGGKNITLNNFNGALTFQNNVGDNSQPLGNITINSSLSSFVGTKSSGVINAASLVTTNPVLGNVDLSSLSVDLTGAAGLRLSTDHDGHVVTVLKDTAGTGYFVGDVLTIDGGTGATVRVESIDAGGAVASLLLLTAGTGYSSGAQTTTGGTGTGATVIITANVTSSISLNAVNLNSAGSVTLNSATDDTVFLQGNITNAVGFDQNGAVSVTLGLAQPVTISTSSSTGMDFEGNLLLAQNATLNAGGGVRVGGTIDSVDSNNLRSLSISSTAGTIQTDREIGVTNKLLTFSANAGVNGVITIQDTDNVDTTINVITQSGITLTGDLKLVEAQTNLDGGNGGAIDLLGNVIGATGSDLLLKTNSAGISISGANGIGSSTNKMGNIAIDGLPASLSITGSVYAESLETINNLAGAITVTGLQSITNYVKLFSNGGPITVGDITTLDGDIQLEANSGAVTTGVLAAGKIAPTSGDIFLRHGNTLTLNGNISGQTFTEVAGSVGAIIVGNNQPVTFQVSGTDSGFKFLNPVQLKQNLAITSNSDVVFGSTLDTEASASSRNLAVTILAGVSRDVAFNGNVGANSGNGLGDITITGANDLSAGNNSIKASSLTATVVDLGADTGDINLQGPQTYSSAIGLNLTADGTIDVGSITTSNNGGVIFNNKNTLNLLGDITSSGVITQVKVAGGTPLVNIGGTNSSSSVTIQSTSPGIPVSFDSNIVLNRDAFILSSGSGTINLGTAGATNTSITSGATGSYNLNVQASGGALVNINSDFGGSSATNLGSLAVSTVSPSGGKINLASRSIGTQSVGGQTFTGNVDFSNTLELKASAGPITFNNQLDSTNTRDITLTTTGNLTFGAIGSSNKVGNIAIATNSSSFTGTSINATSLKSTGAALSGNINISGIQTFTSDLDLDTTANIVMGNSITSNSGKIDLTSGGSTSVQALVTTDATNGTIQLTHGGPLALTGNIISGNSFTETATQSTTISVGTGSALPVTVNVGSGNFQIGKTNVTLLLLNNDLVVTTSGALDDVFFGSPIDSATSMARGITVNSTGDVVFSGAIGQGTNASLGTISLTNNSSKLTATNVNISAGAITTGASTSVQGNIDLSGIISLNNTGGLLLKTDNGGSINLGSVLSSGGGNITLVHAGDLNLLGDVVANASISEAATATFTPVVNIGVTTNPATLNIQSNPTTGFISFANPVTLNQSVLMQAGGDGVISLPTINANSTALTKDLEIKTVGNGTITLGGSIGAGVNGALTRVVVDAGTSGLLNLGSSMIVTTGAGGQTFSAGSTGFTNDLALNAGSGAISFSGSLNTSNASDLDMTTTGAISFSGPVGSGGALGDIQIIAASNGFSATTINAKSLESTVALAGPITITGAQSYADNLDLSTTGSSAISMAGVTTTNKGISLKTAQGSISVGALIANDATNGIITLNHGTGNLTLGGNVIAGEALTITSGLNTLITVGTASSGQIQVDVDNSDITFGTDVNLVQGLVATNRNSKNIKFSGFLDSNGNARQNLVLTTPGTVTFAKTVGQTANSRLGDITLNSGAVGITASGNVNARSFASGTVTGPIVFSAAQDYDGTNGLVVTTTGATGNITLNGVNASAGPFTITNSNTLTLLGNLSSSGQINQVEGTGGTPVTVMGVTTNNSTLNITSSNAGVDLATKFTINQDTNISSLASGLIDLRGAIDSASPTARKMSVSTVNGAINFGGDIGSGTNPLAQITVNAGGTGTISLAGSNVITTGAGGQSFTAGATNINSNLSMAASSGNITFVGALASSNNNDLSLNTTGALSFGGAVSGLGDIDIVAASNGLTATSIGAKSLEGAVALTGAVSITGQQTYADNLSLETAGTANISVQNVSTTNQGITLKTAQGTLTVGTLNAPNSTLGDITLVHGGTLTFSGDVFAGDELTVTTNNGASIVVGTGVDVVMQALGGGISLSGPISLVNSLSATAGDGAITFGSTINSVAGKNLSLALTKANPVTFGGAIGQVDRLGDISITGAPAGINAGTNNISAKSLVAAASSDTVNLSGVLDLNGALGLNLTTTGTTGVAGNITLGQLTTSAGGVTVSNGQVLQFLGNVTSAGTISETGAGTVVLGDTGAVSPTITVQTTVNGSNISLAKNVTLNRDAVLSAAGTGAVTLSGTVDSDGALSPRSLALTSGSGTLSLNGDIGTSTLLSSVNATTAGNISLGAGSIKTTGTGGQLFSATNGTNFTNNLSLDASAGNIGFVGALTSGSKNLSLTTTGALSFGGAVSGLGDIDILAASSGLTASTIGAKSLEGAVALTGAVSITGAQTYTDNLSLETAGTANISVQNVSTTNKGITLKTALGTLTVGTLNSANSVNGDITLVHGGTLTLGGNVFAGDELTVTTNNSASIVVGTGVDIVMTALGGGISLSGPISLVNSLSATAGDGAITFGSTINSVAGRNLSLAMNKANPVTFGGAIGQVDRLGDITITGAPAGINAGTNNISAKSLVAAASSDTVNLSGVLDLNGALGLNLTTTGTTGVAGNITLGQLTTSAGGVTVSNGQVLQFLGNVTSAGTISETGAGTVVLGDTGAVSPTITVQTTVNGSNISLAKNVTLNRDAVLSAAGTGAVTLSGTVDSAALTLKSLVVTSGSGTLSLNGDIGTSTLLSSVNATTAGNISLGAGSIKTTGTGGQLYNAAAGTNFTKNLALEAGSGNIGFVGALTSGGNNLSLTTTGALSFGGAVSGLGDIDIVAASNGLTATSIGAKSLEGAVALTGAVSITGQQTYADNLSLETAGTANISVQNVSTTNKGITLKTAQGTLTVGTLNAPNTTLGDITLTHGNDLTVGGSLNAGHSLTINSSGSTTKVIIGTGTSVSPIQLTSGFGGITLTKDVSLVKSLSVSAPGALSFNGAVDGTTAGNQDLSLNTSSTITFGGNLGQVTRLGAIAVTGSPTGINGGTKNITASSFSTATPVAGAIVLGGVQNYNGAVGLNLSTSGATGDITLGQVTTTAGAVNLINSNTLKFQGNVSSFGPITQQAGNGGTPSVETGITSSSSTLTLQTTSNGSAIDLQSKLTLNQSTSMTAGGSGSISLGSTVDNASLVAARTLSLANNNGLITLANKIGNTTPISQITVNAAAGGTIQMNGGLVKTTAAAGQVYTGTLILGNQAQSLEAAGSGALTFNGDVIGTQNLTMKTSGAIAFNSNIGTGSFVGDILVDGSNPASLNVAGVVNASSLKMNTGISVNGAINILGDQQYIGSGLELATAGSGAISVGNITTVSPTSTVSFKHSGNLNLRGDISDAGTFVQNGVGGGTVFIGNINPTTNIAIGSGGASFNRDVTLNKGVSFTAPGNIAFNENLNSATGLNNDLSLVSGGVLSFAKNVGNTNPLGVIDATLASLTGVQAANLNAVIKATSFNSGVVGGGITLTTPQTYTGANGLNLTTTGAGNNIKIGPVTTSNSGVVSIQNSDTLEILGNLNIDGAFTQTNNDGTSTNEDVIIGATNGLGVAITTSGDNIFFQAPIALVQNSLMTTGATGVGNVTLMDQVNSSAFVQRTLDISNKLGTTTFAGSLGSATTGQLGSVAVTSSVINFNDPLSTLGVVTAGQNGQTYNGQVLLSGNVVMNAGSSGPVSFSSTIDSAPLTTKALTIFGANAVGFASSIGATNALDSLDVSGTGSALTTFNGSVINTTGAGQTFGTAVLIGNLAGAQINLNAGSGQVAFNNTLGVNSKNMTISADEIEINGLVDPGTSGVSNIVFQAGNTATPVQVAGSSAPGQLDISSTELANLVDGFASIKIGRSDSLSNLNVAGNLNNSEIRDPFTLVSGGSITINGTIAAINEASISLIDQNYATGFIGLNNSISTEGRVITIDGVTQIGGSGGQLATTGASNNTPTGANINFNGNSTVSGVSLLTLDAGSSGVINANSAINMSGGVTITNSGGASFNKSVTTGSFNIVDTTAGKDVSFTGTLNASALNTSSSAFNLKLLAGGNVSGNTTLNNTGSITIGDQSTDVFNFAGGLTANSGTLSLAGTVTTTNNAMTIGDAALTAATTLRSGSGTITTGAITGVGSTLSLQNNLATGPVNFGGNLKIGQLVTFAGPYAVSLLGSTNTVSSATSTTFSNTGGVIFGDSTTDVSTFTNGLKATASAVTLAGTVATSNSAMTLGNVTLSQNGTVKSGSGAIAITSVTDGSSALKLSLQDATAASTGTVTISGAVTVNQMETFAQKYAVSLLGSSTVDSASTFLNTGVNTFGDGGDLVDTITFTGGLTAKGGAINLASRLVSTNSVLDIGAVTLTANSTLQSGTGTINLTSLTDGAGSFTLSVQDASGATNQGSFIVNGDVNVFALNTAAKNYAVQLKGNNTVDSAITFNNTAGVNLGSTATNVGTFSNGITAIAGSGSLGLAGTLQSSGNPINLGSSTLLINLLANTTIDSGNSSSGTINLGAIATNQKSLTMTSGSTSGATITVQSVDSTSGGITIKDAGGLVSFTGNVGSSTGSGQITITNSQNGVEFNGPVFGSSLNINNTAATKTIKFADNLTLTGALGTSLQNYNVDILGGSNSIGGNSNFNNLGTVSINGSAAGTTTFKNGFNASFPASLKIQGTVVAGGQVNITKPITLVDATTVTFNSGTNTVSGAVTGSANLTANGSGVLNLTGNSSSYTGVLTSAAGNLAINANYGNASAQVSGNGILSGVGTIKNINASSGVVSPGNSPGTLTVTDAVLGVASGTSATLNMELNSATPGQFDQVKASSSVQLANAVLSITAGNNLVVGQQFQIINGPVSGTFTNAATSISTGNYVFSVAYNGTTGVVLTVTSVVPPVPPTPPTPPTPPVPPTPPGPTPVPQGPFVLFAAGADAGGGPAVRVNFSDGTAFTFFAYDSGFRGGVRVAMGDLNGDGVNEVITAPGTGGGPNIRVFNVSNTGATLVSSFFAFEPWFTGGVYVAAGNLNGDTSTSGNGIGDVIISAGPGGGPRVISFAGSQTNYVNLNSQLCDYFVYSPFFRGGVTVAAGNVFGAAGSVDEIITGAGPGGGPHVRVFTLSSTNNPTSLIEYMAFDPALRNGIYVSAGDLNDDGVDDIFAGTNSSPNLPAMINVRQSNGDVAIVYPFGEFTGGVRVGVAQDSNDNEYLVAAAGPGGGPLVTVFNQNLNAIDSLFVFGLNFTGGVFVNTSIA